MVTPLYIFHFEHFDNKRHPCTQTHKHDTLTGIFFSVDGAWAAWSAWGTCSVTCAGGQKSRSRTCTDPQPANGGLPCSGDSSELTDCNTQACPTVAAGQYAQVIIDSLYTRYIPYLT